MPRPLPGAATDQIIALIQVKLRELGLSAFQVARRAGLPDDSIRSVLNGASPSIDRAQAIADALNITFTLGAPPESREPAPYEAARKAADLLHSAESVLEKLRGQAAVAATKYDHEGSRALQKRMKEEETGRIAEPQSQREDIRRLGDNDEIAGDVATESVVADNEIDQIAEPLADYLVAPLSQDVRAAAGSGDLVFEEAAELHIALPRSAVPTWARLSGLICIRVSGDSMVPTLNDGDLLLLDRSHTEPLDDQLFVIHGDEGLRVKRLRHAVDGWQLVSDNPSWSARVVGERDRVVGRVAWSGS